MRHIIGKLEEGVISLLLVIMTGLVFVEVVMRFGFSSGVLWIQELTLLVSAWFVLIGASYGVRVGAHIGVDAFVKLFPDNIRRSISIVAVLLCLFYCGLLFVGSWEYLEKMHKIGLEMQDMTIKKWMAHSILVIGFGLLFFRFLQLLWKMVKGEEIGFHLADEAEEVLKDLGADIKSDGKGDAR
ncbi:TRAP transporter small permease [Sneathiella glossodoripedis]|uniref:TRAP transporter small permease n=1 Tax=Sneathiella glossodoripedis TaxID=418853 RepID=UPI00046FA921|nr:TRAP transporter small permease [Sneathiella glossodoripedis]